MLLHLLCDQLIPTSQVGIGGHIQAGGFGMMARKYGLASDRLVAATMVDASGRIITADSTQHTDLLWAAKVTFEQAQYGRREPIMSAAVCAFRKSFHSLQEYKSAILVGV